MSEESSKRVDAFVVIPQKEYAQLYNGQYAQVTTLKNQLTLEVSTLRTSKPPLKTLSQSPKDMIRNDYIVTSSDRIQDELNNNDKRPQERQCKSIQLSKQLDEVVAGKQKLKSLSNPIRPIAQRYVDIITRDSSLSPAHRQVFHSYLNTHIDKIPFYLRGINKEKSTNTGAPQSGNRSNLK